MNPNVKLERDDGSIEPPENPPPDRSLLRLLTIICGLGVLLGAAGISISLSETSSASAQASSSPPASFALSLVGVVIGAYSLAILWLLLVQRRRFKALALSDAMELEEMAEQKGRQDNYDALYSARRWREALATTDMTDLAERFHHIVLRIEANW